MTLRIALLATLLVSISFLFAKERILLHRIGPSQSTLFIANADGSAGRPLLPNFGFDYNASFPARRQNRLGQSDARTTMG